MNARLPLLWALVLLALAAPCFAGVANSPPAKTWVLVNSQHFEDVMGGQLYALEHGDAYAFVLTPAQGDYFAAIFKGTTSPVYYYESEAPVAPAMGAQLSALGQPNLHIKNASSLPNVTAGRPSSPALATYFAGQAPSPMAYIVGRTDGAEALSVAPLAAARNAGLYFAHPLNLANLVAALKSENKTVILYGSIAASDDGSPVFDGVTSIHTGSKYADNLQALRQQAALHAYKQVFIVSGQAFEKSMIDPAYPVALAGRTEVSPELLPLLREEGVSTGLVFAGDADIGGAIASLREGGLAVFAKLGEGYSGNSQVQALTVMPLPGPRITLSVDSVRYRASDQTFWMEANNTGNAPAFVRIGVQLPDGRAGSSSTVRVPAGGNAQVWVHLDAGAQARGAKIQQASFLVSSSSEPAMMESVDAVNVSSISVLAGAPAPAPASGNGSAASSSPVPPAAPAPPPSGLWLYALVLLIVVAGGYVFMQPAQKR